MKVRIKGVASTFAMLDAQLNKELEQHHEKVVSSLVKDLADVTPKDTGRAAAGWKISKSLDTITVFNDVPYLPMLNKGSSKQAPARFIERTAIRYGRPLGTIVSER
jgi:hypothetical protein